LAVIFEREDGKSINRQDVAGDDILKAKARGDKYLKIHRVFNCAGKPYKYILWPHSREHGWCTKIEKTSL